MPQFSHLKNHNMSAVLDGFFGIIFSVGAHVGINLERGEGIRH